MGRKLASIQRIISLSKIEGADRIVKATVLGWECVVNKGEFKEGDLCVYCEVDSILPEKPEFEFLRERKFRIKTIRLKGQISQGICFPLSILPKGKWAEGDDVTATLGITKHDPQAAAEQKEYERQQSVRKNRLNKFFGRYKWYRRLIFKPQRLPFPAFIKKTDEDRIQLYPDICERARGKRFSATEKLDGTSYTAFLLPKKGWFKTKYIFGICSRNFHLTRRDGGVYWAITQQADIKEKLLKLRLLARENTPYPIIIQGEIIGSNIQNNPYKLQGIRLYVFNVYLDNQQLDNNAVDIACKFIGLDIVPPLGDYFLAPTIPLCVEWVSKIKSYINPETPAEGIVIRNYMDHLSFKIVNPDFLIKYNE